MPLSFAGIFANGRNSGRIRLVREGVKRGDVYKRQTWFWSRSRREYWNKGATSGHIQRVVSIDGDCDDDALLIRVEQTGAACHTGAHSCFFNRLTKGNRDG